MKRGRQAGQVLALVAICLGALMGFSGIAVDVGYLEYRQQAQQSATDAAAIGGAQQLVRSYCTNSSAAVTAAQSDAQSNGFSNGGNIAVSANTPPQTGPFAGNACAVSVQITTQHVSTNFARLFGFPGGMDESTQAVGMVTAPAAPACIYMLSTSVEGNFNGANVSAPACSLDMNDTGNFNGATISAPFIGYAGAVPDVNGATFKLAAPAPMLPVADPCTEIAGCSYLASNPQSTSPCTSFNGTGYTGPLASGCYSSLNLNGANVTMSGTYVLNGTSIFNGAHVTGTNVTIYVTAAGTAPNFNGATVSLSPPATGNKAGVLYYQVPSNTSNPNFNGANATYSGLIYAPGATAANFNGANGGYVVLVFGAVDLNGGTAVDFATPPPGQSLLSQAVLAQ